MFSRERDGFRGKMYVAAMKRQELKSDQPDCGIRERGEASSQQCASSDPCEAR